jgi:hypothetical protein
MAGWPYDCQLLVCSGSCEEAPDANTTMERALCTRNASPLALLLLSSHGVEND